jgi:hypothetical protein
MPFDPEAVRESRRAGWNRAASAYDGGLVIAAGDKL